MTLLEGLVGREATTETRVARIDERTAHLTPQHAHDVREMVDRIVQEMDRRNPGRPLTYAQVYAQASDRSAKVGSIDALAQAPRPRTRIRVTPRYPYRTQSLPYPTPYDIEYPGPGFVRQCAAWLAPEARPSGTVIVPRSRCWWARG